MEPKGLLVLVARRPMRSLGLRLTRRFRDLVSRDEVASAVDLALLRAADRFDAEKGSFGAFAAIWVRREVLRLVRCELRWRNRYVSGEEALEAASTEDAALAIERSQASRLIAEDADELWRTHVGEGESLREIARTYGLSLRQVQTRIVAAERRLRRKHAPWMLGPARGPGRHSGHRTR